MGRKSDTNIFFGTKGSKRLNLENFEIDSEKISKELLIETKRGNKRTGKLTKKALLKKVKSDVLRKTIDFAYRDNAIIGDGSTSDVLRYEADSKILLSNKGHLQKAKDLLRKYCKILNNHKLSFSETKITKREIKRLNRAIDYWNLKKGK